MKLRTVAAAVIILGSLYGCSSERETSSIYTPAPITPRPTFDATYYRTISEAESPYDEDFVIANAFSPGGRPGRDSEFTALYITPSPDPAERTVPFPELEPLPTILSPEKTGEGEGESEGEGGSEGEGEGSAEQGSYIHDIDWIPEKFISTNYPFYVYSSDGRTYLGKVTLKESDSSESIWNSASEFGASDSSTSIFNPDGMFGSSTSAFSAFNEKAENPPKVFDDSGEFLGVISTNMTFEDSIHPDTLKKLVQDREM